MGIRNFRNAATPQRGGEVADVADSPAAGLRPADGQIGPRCSRRRRGIPPLLPRPPHVTLPHSCGLRQGGEAWTRLLTEVANPESDPNPEKHQYQQLGVHKGQDRSSGNGHGPG